MTIQDLLNEITGGRDLSSGSVKYVQENSDRLKRELEEDLEKLYISYTSEEIENYVELFNCFSEGVHFRQPMFFGLYRFYRANIGRMIQHRQDYLIFTLIDLFVHEPDFFDSRPEYFIEFAEKTYPILAIYDEDLTSFIHNAERKYLQILRWLENNAGINLYSKFRNEDPEKFKLLSF
jgi:hypothetical protein